MARSKDCCLCLAHKCPFVVAASKVVGRDVGQACTSAGTKHVCVHLQKIHLQGARRASLRRSLRHTCSSQAHDAASPRLLQLMRLLSASLSSFGGGEPSQNPGRHAQAARRATSALAGKDGLNAAAADFIVVMGFKTRHPESCEVCLESPVSIKRSAAAAVGLFSPEGAETSHSA